MRFMIVDKIIHHCRRRRCHYQKPCPNNVGVSYIKSLCSACDKSFELAFNLPSAILPYLSLGPANTDDLYGYLLIPQTFHIIWINLFQTIFFMVDFFLKKISYLVMKWIIEIPPDSSGILHASLTFCLIHILDF